MPSITELIVLRDRSTAAERDAMEAKVAEKSATKAVTMAGRALDEGHQRASEANTRQEKLQASVAQIPAAQAELQETERALNEASDELDSLSAKAAELEAEIDGIDPPDTVPQELLNYLKQLRQAQKGLAELHEQLDAAMMDTRARLWRLQAEAVEFDSAKRAAADAKIEVNLLEQELAQMEQTAQSASALSTAVRTRAQALAVEFQRTLDRLITGLIPTMPIALLPVRLETRFHQPVHDQPPTELWIRIYADDIHQDTHEPGLSHDESAWCKHFWRETWRAGLAATYDEAYPKRHAQELAAWQQLAARFGPTRAAYLVRALKPINDSDRPAALNTDSDMPLAAEPKFDLQVALRASSWTRAAQARAMPDRWLAIAYRGGQATRTWGELIPATLNTGPDPSASSQEDPPLDTDVPVDPGMRWMVDFAEAEAKGMGIRMTLSTDDATIGFDRLIVLGVKGTLGRPFEGVGELRALIEAHRFTWGCAFVPQGTATNNTETVKSGYSREDLGFQTSFALEREPSGLTASDDSDAAHMALALGLDIADLDSLRNADRHDQRDAASINRVLWPVTIGYFLDQFLNDVLPGYNQDEWRDFFVQYVRARGPLPAMRFGRQPYGVLPVTSLNRWAGARMDLRDLLHQLLGIWNNASRLAAHPDRPKAETGGNLVEVLGQEAISSSYSWRWARGPRFFELYWRLPGQEVDPAAIDATQQMLETSILNVLQNIGLSNGQVPRLSRTTFAELAFSWEGPLVQAGELSEQQPLADNLNYIHKFVNSTISLDDIHNETNNLFPIDEPRPLLYQLLRHATLLTYAQQVLRDSPLYQPPRPSTQPWFEPELVDMDPDLSLEYIVDPFKTATFWRVLKQVSGGSSANLGDELRAKRLAVPYPLKDYLASLEQLSTLPIVDLERLLGETLDLASHRLDAWITSLAIHRLNQFRNDQLQQNQPRDTYLGGYAWVENLRPRLNSLSSEGFIHAPSIAQATTAAVLRSGYLSHAQSQPEGARLAINLSSKRVRLAQGLIDGVRQGQPLGALLGYRFERRLHDAGSQLDRIITPLRERAPLVGGQLVTRNPEEEPLESIAANNVVDGLALLEQFQQGTIPFSEFKLSPAEQATVDAALNEIADAVDAIGDLAIAEGVHQAVQGNYLRAGATLDAISRGETPSEIQLIKTPQSGVAFTQRLIALFDVLPVPINSWNRNRARAKAEPVLNQWAEKLLGSPEHVRCTALYFNPGKDPFVDTPDYTEFLTLNELDLCALDIIYAPAITGAAQQTELELYLARAAMQMKPATIESDANIRLLFAKDANFQADDLTFSDLFELARAARTLITNGRVVDARDLGEPGAIVDPNVDTEVLSGRLTQVLEAWEQAQKELHDLFDISDAIKLEILAGEPFFLSEDLLDTDVNLLDLAQTANLSKKFDLVDVSTALDVPALSQLDDLRDALQKFTAFSVQGAMPRSVKDDSAEARNVLVLQATGVYAQTMKLRGALADTDLSDPLAVFSLLFGEGFRVLLPFRLNAQQEFEAALARREQADDASPEKVFPWLQTVIGVREGARRLATVLSYSEITGANNAMTLRVAQVPYDVTDVWNKLEGPAANGVTAIVAYAQDNLDLTEPLAGLMLDEWVEVIPNRTAQTALTFHYDSPGACAPQAILLAVSPDPTRPWDTDTLEAILNETLDLVRVRTVDYDALSGMGHLLPAIFLASNAGGDPHGDTVSTEFVHP